MIKLVLANVRVSTWRAAIKLSRRLAPFTWKVLSWCSVISLMLSCFGLHSVKKPQDKYSGAILPWNYSIDLEEQQRTNEKALTFLTTKPPETVVRVLSQRRGLHRNISSPKTIGSLSLRTPQKSADDEFRKLEFVASVSEKRDPDEKLVFAESGHELLFATGNFLNDRKYSANLNNNLSSPDDITMRSLIDSSAELKLLSLSSHMVNKDGFVSVLEADNSEVRLEPAPRHFLAENYGRSAFIAMDRSELATPTPWDAPTVFKVSFLFEPPVFAGNALNRPVPGIQKRSRAIKIVRTEPATSCGAIESTDRQPRVNAEAAASPKTAVEAELRAVGFKSSMHGMSSAPNVIVQMAAPEDKNPHTSKLFWISLCGMIVSSFTSITTLVLTWISLHRKKAEGILMKFEIEKRQLEIAQLRIDLEKARREASPAPTLILASG
jgi:hypothetical protein